MVKVAIAGGSGDLAHAIIDSIVATGKHEVVVFSRRDAGPAETIQSGTSWAKVDYSDKNNLVQALQGVHTVLSFVTSHLDPEGTVQKNLIDASIEAGVKRFAPSEWSVRDPALIPWYATKTLTRQYLTEINKDKKVIEYTLFQPGMLLDYLAYPHQTSPYLTPLEPNIDLQNRRAIVLADAPKGDYQMVYTSLKDLAAVVAAAISYEGEWPVTGGIRGSLVSSAEIIALGEKIRGGKFKVETVSVEDLKKGEVKSSWVPMIGHPSVPKDQVEAMSRVFLAGLLLGAVGETYTVSDEWNKLLPQYKFQGMEEFLEEVWKGKE